jgi:histidyl-tRNA synthetase
MRGGLRSQLKQANRRASKLVIIIGEDELARGEVTLRDMETGEQSMVPTTAITSILQERLGA